MKGSSRALIFTLQEFGVDEQLQRQEEHHQEDAGHQDAVEAGAEQADLPEGHAATAAGLQPVGPGGEGKRARVSPESIHTHAHTHTLARSLRASLHWKLQHMANRGQQSSLMKRDLWDMFRGTAGPCEETPPPPPPLDRLL